MMNATKSSVGRLVKKKQLKRQLADGEDIRHAHAHRDVPEFDPISFCFGPVR